MLTKDELANWRRLANMDKTLNSETARLWHMIHELLDHIEELDDHSQGNSK